MSVLVLPDDMLTHIIRMICLLISLVYPMCIPGVHPVKEKRRRARRHVSYTYIDSATGIANLPSAYIFLYSCWGLNLVGSTPHYCFGFILLGAKLLLFESVRS